MARGSLWQIYKKRVKPPIFDASNVHSRAFGFVFVPVYRCFPAIYRAKKRNTKKKSANFVAKVPVKRRKTGSFSAKAAHLRTPLGFPPSALPFHGPAAPRFLRPVRTSARSLAPPPAGAGGVWVTSHAATRNAPAVPARKDVRLELHARRPEGTPFTDGDRGRTQCMVEKQSGKCHIERRAHAQIDSNCGNGRADAPRLFEKCRRTGEKQLSNITLQRKIAFRPPGPLSGRGKKLHRTTSSTPHTAIIHTENQNIQRKTPPRYIKFNEGEDEASTL